MTRLDAPSAGALERPDDHVECRAAENADRLAETWRTVPHVFQAIEVDFTAIDRVRGEHKRAFQEAHGFSLTYLLFIARATCLAIQSFPQVNARFDGKSLSLSTTVSSASPSTFRITVSSCLSCATRRI
jgi:pyruvate/2-oxoglutarate dehydrogenase complex dihydrolipoamide acyltransferase (E2) component